MGYCLTHGDRLIIEISKAQELINRCVIPITLYYPDMFQFLPGLVSELDQIQAAGESLHMMVKLDRVKQIWQVANNIHLEIVLREYKRRNVVET